MDKYFSVNGITFIWDSLKEQTNPKNHDGITFKQAIEAFSTTYLW